MLKTENDQEVHWTALTFEYCIQNFPRFGRYFFDSYRIFPTATDFFRQLPNFTNSYRILPTATDLSDEKRPIFSDRFLRFYLYIPSPFPNPPIPSIPDPAPPFCPAGPVELRLPPSATCTKRPNFTDTATELSRQLPNFPTGVPIFADSYRIFRQRYRICLQKYRILRTATEFCRQNYRILPTEKKWETSSPFHSQHVPGLMAAKMHPSNALRRACQCAWL